VRHLMSVSLGYLAIPKSENQEKNITQCSTHHGP
jgi:hypothetical protein